MWRGSRHNVSGTGMPVESARTRACAPLAMHVSTSNELQTICINNKASMVQHRYAFNASRSQIMTHGQSWVLEAVCGHVVLLVENFSVSDESMRQDCPMRRDCWQHSALAAVQPWIIALGD